MKNATASAENDAAAMKRQVRWMDTGFELGKILVKHREDIYDRSNNKQKTLKE